MRDIIDPMLRNRLCFAVPSIITLTCLMAGCRDNTPPPIVVADRAVTVQNQSDERWTDVKVWLNDHYLAATPSLEPGQRFTVQQRNFVAAMGQMFDPSRQGPYGVLVTATSAKGRVTVVWGKPYRKQ